MGSLLNDPKVLGFDTDIETMADGVVIMLLLSFGWPMIMHNCSRRGFRLTFESHPQIINHTVQWSILNAISVLAEMSRMPFLNARGAKMKSIWAKRSGDQGVVKPSVAVSLKVHFLLSGFWNNVFMITKSAKRQKSI